MLNLQNVSFSGERKKILDNINIDILKGDFFCIIGINGSGKTTLLKAISNLIDYEGDIFIEKKNIKKIKITEFARKLAFMEQVRNFEYHYKVIDIVLFARYPFRKGIFNDFLDDDYRICENALTFLGLIDKKNSLITELSGGEQQRVFLAQIFAQNSDILILDEPTSFLDLRYKIEILEYIKKWAIDNQKTIVCALHDLEFAIKYSTKVALMDRGKILEIGEPKKIILSQNMKECFKVDIPSFYREFLSDF